jgi:membrane protein DedA with SNARE-associated domain
MSEKQKKKKYDFRQVSQSARELSGEIPRKRWSVGDMLFGMLGLAITIALAVVAIAYREEITDTEYVARYGLLGILVIAFIAASAFSVTAIPVPYWVLTFTLPSVLAGTYGIWAPVWVGLFAAAGATLGQLITFIIGYGGRGLSEKLSSRFSPALFEKAKVWMKRWGDWAVFFMSVTANPLHLPMTLAISSLRYPMYRFIIFGFIGQLIKSMVLSFSGYYSLTWILNILGFNDAVIIAFIIIAGVVILLALWQLIVWILETQDKNRKYKAAEASAKKSGKPLLVIGGPWGVQPARRLLNMPAHGEGDVCLDIDRRALEGHRCPVVASVTDIPFADKAFGAVFLSHVLEHLPTPDDARRALQEMQRVAEVVYIVYPSRQSIAAWVIKEHRLWVWQAGTKIHLLQRRMRGKREKLVVETANKAT